MFCTVSDFKLQLPLPCHEELCSMELPHQRLRNIIITFFLVKHVLSLLLLYVEADKQAYKCVTFM